MHIKKSNENKGVELLPKVSLLDVRVSTGSYSSFLHKIVQLGDSRESSYVCFANVHMLMEAQQNPDISQVVNQAELVAPDGRPLSLLMNRLYGLKQDRACGMDMFPDILAAAEQKGLGVFFYGSTEEVIEAIKVKAKEDYPLLRIAGAYSPPFRQLNPEEDQDVVDMINNSGAQLVFVSLGCPKQEKWMCDHKGKINACMLGLGQAFLTYAGLEKRLPVWARNLSLEWLYRFYLEPGRLWKRYLLGNSRFLYQAGKSLFMHAFKPKSSL